MISIAWIFNRLLEAAAGSFVLFAVGTLAVLCCRQPVRRTRLIALTLAGSVLVPVLNLLPLPNLLPRLNILPGLPHWSLPVIGTAVAPDGARQPEGFQEFAAPAKLAESRSIDEPSLAAAEEIVDSGDTTDRTGLVSGDPESSTDVQSVLALVDRRGFPKGPAPATQSIPAADVRSPSVVEVPEPPAPASAAAVSVLPQFDLTIWIVGSYFMGVAALTTWWFLGFVALWRLLRTARPAPDWCRTALQEIAGPAGDRVRLLVSRRAAQPFTFGWYWPVIVLPEEMTVSTLLTSESQPGVCSSELRWSLVHEWSHVARGDVRLWSVAGLVRLVYFYQPLCWWLRRELRLCQDYIADAAAAHESSPDVYAEFLAARGVGRPLAVGLGIAGCKSDLYRRIVMLVQNRRSLETRCPRWWTVAAATSAVSLVLLAATYGNKPAKLVAADQSTGSRIRENSDRGPVLPPNSDEADDPGRNTSDNRYAVTFRELPDPVDPDATDDPAPAPSEKPAATIETAPEAAAKQKLLDGVFARATAIKSGRFETTLVHSRDGMNSWDQWRFDVSGANWSRARGRNRSNLQGVVVIEQLTVVRAGHLFTLAHPSHSGPPGMSAHMPPTTLTINWPNLATLSDDSGGSPPIQVGTIWYRATIPYLRDHSGAARLVGTARVNECDTQFVEWPIPADAARTAFVRLNNLLSGGGVYRIYVSEKLGYALARIEYVDRFGTPQFVFDFSEFHEPAPGIHIPRNVSIQEAGDVLHIEILDAANVNEPIDDREFILKIPAKTHVVDNRPHRGDLQADFRSGAIYDKQKYPLRTFTTGAEYPDGLPAAMLAEMDRDAIPADEKDTTSKRAPTVVDVKLPEQTPELGTKQPAKQEPVAGKTSVEEITFTAANRNQNVPAKKRLLYGGKNFQVWRDELLTELEPASRIKALHALGELGANGYAEEAAAAIVDLLKTGFDPNEAWDVYSDICLALIRLGAAGVPVLESEFRRSDPNVRSAALDALVKLAGKTDAAAPALLKAASDDDFGIRVIALGALAGNCLAAPGVIEVLIAALNEDDERVRWHVLTGIEQSRLPANNTPWPEKTVQLLKVGLHDGDSENRGLAAYFFAARAPATAENVALLRQVLLGATSECVSRFLLLMTQHRPASVRDAAMVVPSLIAIIESADSNAGETVQAAVAILGDLARDKAALAAIPVLIKGLRGELPSHLDDSRSRSYRDAFADALGQFGPAAAEALPALKEILDADNRSNPPPKAAPAAAAPAPVFRGSGKTQSGIESAIRHIEGKKK